MGKYFWVALNTVLGFALGWLISFGFLNLDHPVVIGLICTGSAGLHGFIWFRILDNKNKRPSMKYIFIVFQSIIVLIIGGLFISQKITFQNTPMISRSYEKSFEHLYHAIDKAYPYFEQKGVDWNLIYEKYQPEALAAQNDQEFQMVIAHMLGELEDAHTKVVYPHLERKLYASVRNVGDLAIVNQVGYSAEMAGLQPGMLLLEVDDKPIEEIIPDIDISLNEASTEWGRKIRAFNQLLAVPVDADEVLKVKAIKPNGEEVDLMIRQLTAPIDVKPIMNNQNSTGIGWEELSQQVGYIRIDRLWNGKNDIVSEFDSALDAFKDKQGIILDLRQNGGGDSKIAEKIAARFMDKDFIYGQEKFRTRLFKFAWRKSVNYSVKPGKDPYLGKLVVLTDYQVMSSAEWLVGALVDSGRAISVGRVTGGASGNPIKFVIPGGEVRYSCAAFYRPDGSLIEGFGYSPGIAVEWTIDDYLKGIDPDIQAALNWMDVEE